MRSRHVRDYPYCFIELKSSLVSRLPQPKLDLLQGTVDLMVLQTLAAMGPLHGYGIARIEQSSGNEVLLNPIAIP